jgi:hypothetical protein
MRASDCPCEHHLEGADDEALFRLVPKHVGRDHRELERIANDAYDMKEEAIDA